MKNIKQIKNILSGNMGEIEQRFSVRKLGIFGSYVRNEQRPNSDTDILVEFSKPVGMFEFMELEQYLEKLLKNKVDMVSKKALKPCIGKRILKEVVYI